MTDADYRTIQALACCHFYPGSWVKRFVRDLATFPREKELSEKQAAALARVAWHYRKQLARHGVAVETRPPDALGTDREARAAQRDQEALDAWNNGEPIR